jgi:hypothetical protein
MVLTLDWTMAPLSFNDLHLTSFRRFDDRRASYENLSSTELQMRTLKSRLKSGIEELALCFSSSQEEHYNIPNSIAFCK